jgi:hypothetical protein
MNEAARLCARLVREGAVLRSECPELDHVDVRREVERRLDEAGLVLATSAYSDHVGIRLSREACAHSAFDAASNLGLGSDACALLVVAWARLVLQKRTAADTRQLPGQGHLLAEDRARAAREYRPQMRLSTLVREFGQVIGSRTRIKSLVTLLRKARFLAGRGETIEAGPFLELGIDGEQMIAFIRREVLAGILREASPAGDVSKDDGLDLQVLKVLEGLGGSAGMPDIVRETGDTPPRLRAVLKDLEAQGKVRRHGARSKTRYEAVE